MSAKKQKLISSLQEINAWMKLAKEEAPHLYRYKLYQWAYDFIYSLNRINIVCAGNQASKSSAAIRKNILFATHEDIKKLAWPDAYKFGNIPNLFWYLYPSLDTATEEFENKWVQFLVMDSKRVHSPHYATVIKKQGSVRGINFPNAKTRIMFKTYGQERITIQSATVFMVTADEELPIKTGADNFLDELLARLGAVDGIFNAIFTATLAQEFWRKVVEEKGKDEIWPDAFKQQISLYDCTQYMDGDTNTPWNHTKIKRLEMSLSNHNEVLKRIWGRFTTGLGLIIHGFDRQRNVVKNDKIGTDWRIYSAVDIGAGGTGDAAGIVFVAVNPDNSKGKVIKIWKGPQNIETSTADILLKYKELRTEIYKRYHKMPHVQLYDPASKDFGILARERNEHFAMANKHKEIGLETLNSILKFKILEIVASDEAEELINEFNSCTEDAIKKRRKRIKDLIDALRYCIMAVPWDFSLIEKPDMDIPIIEAAKPEKGTFWTSDLAEERHKAAMHYKKSLYRKPLSPHEIDLLNYANELKMCSIRGDDKQNTEGFF